MIIDIPTPDDFRAQAVVFLNLGWDAVIGLYLDLEESGIEELDDDGSWSDEYWTAAQRPLANAYTLAGQGAEFLLKALISEVSPFLLIQGSSRDWPAGAQSEDIPFARFRTADAQDLPRIHDTVRPVRLDPAFRTTLERVREARNTIMHTVDKKNRIAPNEVLATILEVVHHIVGERSWVQTRWDYHAETPRSKAYSADHVDSEVNLDIVTAVRVLAPAEVMRYFGIDKKQRRYICSRCGHAIDDYERARTALLDPPSPETTVVRCFVCAATETVLRQDCSEPGCRGNVIGTASGACLTCFADGSQA